MDGRYVWFNDLLNYDQYGIKHHWLSYFVVVYGTVRNMIWLKKFWKNNMKLKVSIQLDLYLWVLICIWIQFWSVLNILSNVQVRRRTLAVHDARSYMMQYGDINMNKDCLFTYFDSYHVNCINDNYATSNPTRLVSQRNAHLISLVLVLVMKIFYMN